MDTRSKALLAILFLLIIASASATYYRTIYTRNFEFEATPAAAEEVF